MVELAAFERAGFMKRITRRIEAGLRDPLATPTEAAFKYQRLRTLRHLGKSPKVLIVGASVLDGDLNPAIIDKELGVTGASFNAGLVGCDLATLKSWCNLISSEVDPDVLVVEAQPALMFPSAMAAKLTRQLALLMDDLDSEPSNAFVTGPGAIFRSLSSMFRPDPEFGVSPESGVSRSRNYANGYLPEYRDVDFDAGCKKRFRGRTHWFATIGLDYSGVPLMDEYFDVILKLSANVKHVIVVIPPLLLEASTATCDGALTNRRIGDEVLSMASELGVPVLDLRYIANSVEDFADPFHLRSDAVKRCSAAVAERVAGLL